MVHRVLSIIILMFALLDRNRRISNGFWGMTQLMARWNTWFHTKVRANSIYLNTDNIREWYLGYFRCRLSWGRVGEQIGITQEETKWIQWIFKEWRNVQFKYYSANLIWNIQQEHNNSSSSSSSSYSNSSNGGRRRRTTRTRTTSTRKRKKIRIRTVGRR